MATLKEKIDAELKVRALIEASGLPEPDQVEYGYTCIRLFWHESKSVMIVDIDEDPEAAPDADQAGDAALSELDVNSQPPTAGGGS